MVTTKHFQAYINRRTIAKCGLGGVVEKAHLVSWPSVVRGNWTRVVLFCCILGCLLFLICIEFVHLYFPVLFCLSVSVKWLAACEDRLRNDLYCVEWGVKLYSNQPSLKHSRGQSMYRSFYPKADTVVTQYRANLLTSTRKCSWVFFFVVVCLCCCIYYACCILCYCYHALVK